MDRGAPRACFELSLVLALPAQSVLLVLCYVDASTTSARYAPDIETKFLLFGVGAVVTVATLWMVRVAVEGRWLSLFSLYVAPLAFATMAWAYARP